MELNLLPSPLLPQAASVHRVGCSLIEPLVARPKEALLVRLYHLLRLYAYGFYKSYRI